MSVLGVRRDKAALSSGCKPHPALPPAEPAQLFSTLIFEFHDAVSPA